MLITLVLFLLMSIDEPSTEKSNYINSGNCSYAENTYLNFVCEGKYDEDLRDRWSDRRVSLNTRYAVWASSKEKDAIILASFRRSDLWNYETILVAGLHYKLLGVINGEGFEVLFDNGNLNCFSYGLRYVSDLRNNCMDLGYKPDDIAEKALLHYANPVSKA
ncbi:hypothetical protein KR093_002144 [Drosophila rubida]|uniref:Uncharacterized protein n=1 Tax=Drosophila rubida TaxID=30044 RepID=A0AAD4K034_9MUSC|nr:hypothetical protein KR093_002144 [Drosophila rubida]